MTPGIIEWVIRSSGITRLCLDQSYYYSILINRRRINIQQCSPNDDVVKWNIFIECYLYHQTRQWVLLASENLVRQSAYYQTFDRLTDNLLTTFPRSFWISIVLVEYISIDSTTFKPSARTIFASAVALLTILHQKSIKRDYV